MLGFATGGGAVALALLVVAAGGMATTIKAPFKGVITIQHYVDSQGCGKLAATHPWAFNLTSGKGGFAGTATAKTCKKSIGGVGQSSYMDMGGGFDLGMKVGIPTGVHSVGVSWSAGWKASGAESAMGVCPTTVYRSGSINYTEGFCYSESGFYTDVYGYLKDLTNGSVIYNYNGLYLNNYTENYTDIYWYCTSSGCVSYNYTYHSPTTSFSWTGSAAATMYFNGTFVSTHHYALVLYVYGDVYADISGWPHAFATGTTSVWPTTGTGMGLSLNSVTIT